MFWKIKKMLVSSTNIKKYRARKNRKNGTDYVYIHNPFHFLFFFQKTGKYANFSVVICVYASFFALLLFIWLFFSYNRKGMSEGENI
ncbi:hypothetical protein DVX21_10150 [Enterococcus faecium]|nr:hypothetical protein DVW97_10455 [Enterococcus faecium]TKN53324.1 hypothetical protein DVX18_10650 [Enterococcus faecium]TKN54872.1 hypothetical protein DVX16_10715 [Enterococcus faecium]TKN70226.1 hypothetical protein DVX21_10150 [Enterococcus faecium]TKN88857.1 hypothetical protein DVX33_10195 [Enterococcus faecium]